MICKRTDIQSVLPGSSELGSGGVGAASSFCLAVTGLGFHFDVVSGAGFALNVVVDAVINAAANAAELTAMAVIILHASALPEVFLP